MADELSGFRTVRYPVDVKRIRQRELAARRHDMVARGPTVSVDAVVDMITLSLNEHVPGIAATRGHGWDILIGKASVRTLMLVTHGRRGRGLPFAAAAVFVQYVVARICHGIGNIRDAAEAGPHVNYQNARVVDRTGNDEWLEINADIQAAFVAFFVDPEVHRRDAGLVRALAQAMRTHIALAGDVAARGDADTDVVATIEPLVNPDSTKVEAGRLALDLAAVPFKALKYAALAFAFWVMSDMIAPDLISDDERAAITKLFAGL